MDTSYPYVVFGKNIKIYTLKVCTLYMQEIIVGHQDGGVYILTWYRK